MYDKERTVFWQSSYSMDPDSQVLCFSEKGFLSHIKQFYLLKSNYYPVKTSGLKGKPFERNFEDDLSELQEAKEKEQWKTLFWS